MSEKTIRAVGYIRVSTAEQVEGFSLDNQKEDIRKHCDYKEWELVDTFADEGLSGGSLDERKGLSKALRLMKDEDIEYLVVWKVSRLARNVNDIVLVSSLLKDMESYLSVVKEPIDTSNDLGQHFLTLAGIFAQIERDNIIVQVKGGMKERASQGFWNGGAPPLGYDLVEKQLVINEDERKIVELIFEEYLKGQGYLAIVDTLKNKGYKTKRHISKKGKIKEGKDFSGNTVKEILRNPTYKGIVRWGYRKDWGKKDKQGKRKRKYEENPIEVIGKHEPIIKEDDFDRVQDMIENNPRRHLRRFQGFHLLSGLLRCPVCDYGMSYQPVKSRGKLYEYYTCNQYVNKKQCKPNLIPKKEIEEQFLDILDRVVSENDFKNLMTKVASNSETQITEVEDRIKRKEKEIGGLERESSNLLDTLSKGVSERYKIALIEKVEDKEERIEELKLSIRKDEREIRELQSKSLNIDDIIGLLENTGKIIKELDKEDQQDLVRQLISKIEVKDKKIRKIHFTFNEVLELDDKGRTVPQVTAVFTENEYLQYI